MKLRNISILSLLLIIIASCKNDDNGLDGEVVPPQLLSDAAIENDENIVEFLKTHFYNYEEFATPPADFDFKIRFDTIAGDNSDKISIFDSGQLEEVEFITETISIESSSFGRDDGEVVDHKLYILVARKGESIETPTIGDNVILRYEGSNLNDTENYLNKTLTQFDASSEQPTLFNLSQVVRGFGNGLEYFRTGSGPLDSGGGTVEYEDFGIGTIFMPSGLGYFSGSGPGGTIQAYSPLFFNVDALDFQSDTDTDEDGIPSTQEDLDGDGNLNNDNTDGDLAPDYLDTDDDNDGTLTRNEIVIAEDGTITYPDTDGDGIPNYLDTDNSEDLSL